MVAVYWTSGLVANKLMELTAIWLCPVSTSSRKSMVEKYAILIPFQTPGTHKVRRTSYIHSIIREGEAKLDLLKLLLVFLHLSSVGPK